MADGHRSVNSLVCMFLNSVGVELDAGVSNRFLRHEKK